MLLKAGLLLAGCGNIVLALPSGSANEKCSNGNCFKAIKYLAYPDGPATADCKAFLHKTIPSPASTVYESVTVSAPTTTGMVDVEIAIPTPPPCAASRDGLICQRQQAYASACLGSKSYSSACSCIGVTATTTTDTAPTTITKTITAAYAASTDEVTVAENTTTTPATTNEVIPRAFENEKLFHLQVKFGSKDSQFIVSQPGSDMFTFAGSENALAAQFFLDKDHHLRYISHDPVTNAKIVSYKASPYDKFRFWQHEYDTVHHHDSQDFRPLWCSKNSIGGLSCDCGHNEWCTIGWCDEHPGAAELDGFVFDDSCPGAADGNIKIVEI